MAVTYTLSNTGTTFAVNYRAAGPTLGIYTFNQKRGFLSFDLTGSGLTVDVVQTVQLILRVSAVTGGGSTFVLRSAIDPNGFGATLDATHDDWASTKTHDEQTMSITNTGVVTWTVDKTHINYGGVTYFSMENTLEGTPSPYNSGITMNSREAGTPANRPVLRFVAGALGAEKEIIVTSGAKKDIVAFSGIKKVAP